MNLIQIQEDLKGMPTQAIMGYANGQNPEVPPYVALAELNRRKQLEQGMQAQGAPQQQGTVKDRITQDVGLMHLQQQRQQQAMQSIAQGAQKAPSANPMPAMAAGGIVALAEGGTPLERWWDEMSTPKSEKDPEWGERERLKSKLADQYGTRAGLMGMLMSQSDEERAQAKAVMAGKESMSPDQMRVLLGRDTLETPEAQRFPGQPMPQTQPALPAQGETAAPAQPGQQPSPQVQPGAGRGSASAGIGYRGPAAPSGGVADILKALKTEGMRDVAAPQAPEYGAGLGKAMEIMDPYIKAEEEKKQAYIQLLRDQQAKRERGDADAMLRGFFQSMADGGGRGNWGALAAGTRGAGMVSAEQQRLADEAQRQIATEEAGLPALRRAEAEKQLEKSSKHAEDVYKTTGNMYSHDRASKVNALGKSADYYATMESIRAQMAIAREKGASGNDMIKWAAEERKRLNDQIDSVDSRMKAIGTPFTKEQKSEYAQLAAQKDKLTMSSSALQEVIAQHVPGLAALTPKAAGQKVIDFGSIK